MKQHLTYVTDTYLKPREEPQTTYLSSLDDTDEGYNRVRSPNCPFPQFRSDAMILSLPWQAPFAPTMQMLLWSYKTDTLLQTDTYQSHSFSERTLESKTAV